MAESDLTIHYVSDEITEGRMPLRDLAPSLLALSELVDEANRIVRPDGTTIGIDIQATQRGSFLVHLIVTALGDGKDLMASAELTALNNFVGLVFGPAVGGLNFLIGALRNRTIVSEEERPDGTKHLTLNDGMELDTSNDSLRLYRNHKVTESLSAFVHPITQGIERIDIKREEETILSIGEAEAPAYAQAAESPSEDRRLLFETVGRVVLTIDTAQLTDPGERTWRFNDGGSPFSASIEDQDFLRSVERGEEDFVAGDLLVAQMRTRQYQSEVSGRLSKDRSIVEVEAHLKAEEQSSFDFGSGQ